MKNKDELANFTNLGYPSYLMTIIGVWKILGVMAILIPKRLILKEWAYAGFFFVMSGAVISHLIVGDTVGRTFPVVLLLVLVIISGISDLQKEKLRLLINNFRDSEILSQVKSFRL